MWHDGYDKEWGTLRSQDLTTSAIYYVTLINSRTLQGKNTRAVVQVRGGAAVDGMYIDRDSQGGGRTK